MRFFFALIAAALLASCLAACSSGRLVQREAYVFGTRVELVSIGADPQHSAAAMAEVLREFDRIHRAYHAWQPSELSAVTSACASGQPLDVTPELAELIRRAQQLSTRSEGLFEPAIGGLIAAWGFHAERFEARLPPAATVERLRRSQPQVAQIDLDEQTLHCDNPAVALDLGGFAKGWALDRAAAILRAHGIHNALINIGGNVMALGKKGKVPWLIGIQHPRKDGALATLALLDGEAVGTSGDYQRYFELAGRRYSHLIDPRSGEPAQGTQALTVLIPAQADAGLLSDVSSKPLFIAGPDWQRLAARMGVRSVLRIDAAGRIEVTRDMLERLRFSGDVRPDLVVD